MLKQNSEICSEARAALKGNWSGAVIATLVYMVVACLLSLIPVAGPIIGLFVTVPLAWGLYIASLELYRNGTPIDYKSLGDIFKNSSEYKRVTFTILLQALYTLLWMLLLYVPGIIKAMSYCLTYFILKDEPTLSNNAAIEKSMAMMEGNKMKAFTLYLRFIGWSILAAITLVGILWLIPYMTTSYAAFYEDIKKNYTPQV